MYCMSPLGLGPPWSGQIRLGLETPLSPVGAYLESCVRMLSHAWSDFLPCEIGKESTCFPGSLLELQGMMHIERLTQHPAPTALKVLNT
jgi:hypothetical protein